MKLAFEVWLDSLCKCKKMPCDPLPSVPGTPASPIIYNLDVYAQGLRYSPEKQRQHGLALVSGSDYATTAELAPSQPGEEFTNAISQGRKCICTTISPSTITEMLETNVNVVDLAEWKYVTHVVYQGLNVTPSGKVSVQGDGPQCKVLGSAFTYLQLLYAIKRAHPHLSIVWAFPASFRRGSFMERMIMEPASGTFWSTLEYTLHHVQADGCELNFEHLCHYPANFISDLIGFGYRSRLHLVLNNRVQWKYDNALDFLNCMQSLVGKIVINSFGYFDYISADEETQAPRMMVRSMESALYHFQLSLEQVLGTVPRHKILMGIDTCGVMFRSGADNQADLSLVPLCEIQRIFQLGYVDETGKKWEFDRHVSGRAGGACMVARECVGACPFVSYDSYQVRRKKVNFVIEEMLGGVSMGNLSGDLFSKNRRSLVNICHYYLTEEHKPDVIDADFCDNDDECELDSVFIID